MWVAMRKKEFFVESYHLFQSILTLSMMFDVCIIRDFRKGHKNSRQFPSIQFIFFSQMFNVPSGQCQSVCSNCRIGSSGSYFTWKIPSILLSWIYLHPQWNCKHKRKHCRLQNACPPFVPMKYQLNSIVLSQFSECASFKLFFFLFLSSLLFCVSDTMEWSLKENNELGKEQKRNRWIYVCEWSETQCHVTGKREKNWSFEAKYTKGTLIPLENLTAETISTQWARAVEMNMHKMLPFFFWNSGNSRRLLCFILFFFSRLWNHVLCSSFSFSYSFAYFNASQHA